MLRKPHTRFTFVPKNQYYIYIHGYCQLGCKYMVDLVQGTQYAYVDESGDPELEFEHPGRTRFYVVCAALVSGEENQRFLQAAEQIRSRFFGDAEMKSSSVKGNSKRRAEVLEAISQTDAKVVTVTIDKAGLSRESRGLHYRKSFIKHMQQRLYRHLYRAFGDLHIQADQHGSERFMQGFKDYLAERCPRLLFDRLRFDFVPSAGFVGVQVADMIGGSLRRLYAGEDPVEPWKALASSLVIAERWPPSDGTVEGTDRDEVNDVLVMQQGIRQITRFIAENDGSDDPNTEAQVEAARFLLHRFELDPATYTYTAEILNYLNRGRQEPLSEHTFRSRIIAGLRNQGVIVASSNKGYKIPSSAEDMDSFVELVRTQTIPYLQRLGVARDHLLLASNKAYDAVPAERYPDLANCLRSIGLPDPH